MPSADPIPQLWNDGYSGILFLGTGASSGTPQIHHVLPRKVQFPISQDNTDCPTDVNNRFRMGNVSLTEDSVLLSNGSCRTCMLASSSPHSPNRRNNVSLVVKCGGINILIDCGKTFRDAALRWFPLHQITELHALLLTHDHQDAMGGIDDLRDLQAFERPLLPKRLRMSTLREPNLSLLPIAASGSHEPEPSSSLSSCVAASGLRNVAAALEMPRENNTNSGAVDSSRISEAVGARGYLPLRRLPTYLSLHTFQSMNKKFEYIIEASRTPGMLIRKTAALEFYGLSDDIAKGGEEGVPGGCGGREKGEQQGVDGKISTAKDRGSGAAGNGGHGVEKMGTCIGETVLIEVPISSDGFSQFCVTGMERCMFTVLPVWHGVDYVSLGFAFGGREKVVYISDVSAIPKGVGDYLFAMQQIKVLILDALHFEMEHFSHFNFAQALYWVEKLQPDSAYFVGMSCDIEHNEGCKYLENWLIEKREAHPGFRTRTVQLAHDGLLVPVELV